MFDIFAESREQARSEAIPWGELEGKCVLITGATGLIGFACARLLLERNRLGLGPQIRVLCLVRNEERAREIFSAYGEDDGLEMVVGSVEDFPQPEGSIDYIVHTACPTASKFFAEHPVETADALVLGTRRVLELARAKGVSGMVYASSMEAYGDGNAEPGLDNLLNESQVGYVDTCACAAAAGGQTHGRAVLLRLCRRVWRPRHGGAPGPDLRPRHPGRATAACLPCARATLWRGGHRP